MWYKHLRRQLVGLYGIYFTLETEIDALALRARDVLASYPGLLRRRDKAWYPLFAHARVAVEFHRRRLLSYTFAVRDEYSSVFLAVREALLFAIYSDDCIVSSFLEALAQ